MPNSLQSTCTKGSAEEFLAYHSPHDSNGQKGQILAIEPKKQL